MEITEVRIKLTEDSDDRLQAFCSITFDDRFVVRDLKIIDGTNGPFVAMPSRKLTGHCPRCHCKNHLRAAYCNQCGTKLNPDRAQRDADGRAKLYADIAHPINSRCREQIQQTVVAAYQSELELSRQPDYVSRYDDAYEDEFTGADFVDLPTPNPAEPPAPPVQEVAVPKPEIQRTDVQPVSFDPPAPHKPPTKPPAPVSPPTPHSPARSKRGFGVGILDE